jgi:hypothetical protein
MSDVALLWLLCRKSRSTFDFRNVFSLPVSQALSFTLNYVEDEHEQTRLFPSLLLLFHFFFPIPSIS